MSLENFTINLLCYWSNRHFQRWYSMQTFSLLYLRSQNCQPENKKMFEFIRKTIVNTVKGFRRLARVRADPFLECHDVWLTRLQFNETLISPYLSIIKEPVVSKFYTRGGKVFNKRATCENSKLPESHKFCLRC